LLQGLDEIGRSLKLETEITAFEQRHLGEVPPIPPWAELAARLS
jgi:hypothetical protein